MKGIVCIIFSWEEDPRIEERNQLTERALALGNYRHNYLQSIQIKYGVQPLKMSCLGLLLLQGRVLQ